MPPEAAVTVPGSELATILYRLDAIERKLDKFTDDHERRIRGLEETTTRLSERMTLWQAAQATFTVIAASLAAFIGRGP